MTPQKEDARTFEDRVAHAVNDCLCEMIDRKEPMDTLRVTASVVALPIVQEMIARSLPPQPTGDVEGLVERLEAFFTQPQDFATDMAAKLALEAARALRSADSRFAEAVKRIEAAEARVAELERSTGAGEEKQ